MPKVSQLPTESPATVAALRQVLGLGAVTPVPASDALLLFITNVASDVAAIAEGRPGVGTAVASELVLYDENNIVVDLSDASIIDVLGTGLPLANLIDGSASVVTGPGFIAGMLSFASPVRLSRIEVLAPVDTLAEELPNVAAVTATSLGVTNFSIYFPSLAQQQELPVAAVAGGVVAETTFYGSRTELAVSAIAFADNRSIIAGVDYVKDGMLHRKAIVEILQMSERVVSDSRDAQNLYHTAAGNFLRWTFDGAKTLTVTDDANTLYGVPLTGEKYRGRNVGTGVLSIVGSGTVLLNNFTGGAAGPEIAAGAAYTVHRIGLDEWDVSSP